MNADSNTAKSNVISNLVKILRENVQTYAIVVALVIIWTLFSALTEGRFVGPQNFSNLFRQMTVTFAVKRPRWLQFSDRLGRTRDSHRSCRITAVQRSLRVIALAFEVTGRG